MQLNIDYLDGSYVCRPVSGLSVGSMRNRRFRPGSGLLHLIHLNLIMYHYHNNVSVD